MSAKAAVRRVINRCLTPLGFELRRFRFEGDSYPVSPWLIARQHRLIVSNLDFLPRFFQKEISKDEIAKHVQEYYDAFPHRPISQGAGGCGFNAGLILFVAARIHHPSTIIESGTFKGFSAWVFHTACPQADVHCYDISFAELQYKDRAIHFHEHDWTVNELAVSDATASLCFFDDHVSQAQRIIEAHRRGFKHIIFDDNLPTHALHRDGTPAVCTVDMLEDESLVDGQTIEWTNAGRKFVYRHDAALAANARSCIKQVVRAPSLQDVTGYAPANLTFVELK